MQNDIESNVNVKCNPVSIATRDQIRDLNNLIKTGKVLGDTPNDLYDKRDALVDELSQLVSVRVTVTLDPNFTDRQVGIYQLDIGDEGAAQTLVDDSTVTHLQTVTNADGFTDIQYNGSAFAFGTDAGSLSADIEMRDTYLPGLLQQFDDLAEGIVTAVNSIPWHTFFDAADTTAETINLPLLMKVTL
jgi:flagellar hook-associated protein 1 FlgK